MLTNEELETLIIDVNELHQRIENVDKLLIQIEDDKLRKEYQNELDEMIFNYNQLCEYLKEELEAYVQQEKINKWPVNFTYRKILRNLTV